MRIISRYILKAHIGPFLFGFITVIFIFLMQFLMNFLDELVGKGLSNWVIFQLIIYYMAWMVVLAFPMGVLFSTLMAFGNMSASHEITVLKASGTSLLKLMKPAIIMGALISIGTFFFNDNILPEANHKSKTMMIDIKKKKPTFSLESGKFSSEIDGYTIFPRRVDSLTGMMYGVTIYDQRSVVVRNIISADSGYVAFSDTYENLMLRLFSGEIHRFEFRNADNYRVIDFDKYQVAINARGFTFEETDRELISRGDRELRISDMRQIVDKAKHRKNELDSGLNQWLVKHYDYLTGNDINFFKSAKKQYSENNLSGINNIKIRTKNDSVASNVNLNEIIKEKNAYNSAFKRMNFFTSTIKSDMTQSDYQDKQIRKYEVEIYKKYAIPFACFIFVFVGVPLGIMTKGGKFGVSAGISLLFYIFYWGCLIGGEKLADRGVIAPWLSMWMGNIIIGVLGILLTLKVNYETLTFINFKKLFSGK